MTEQEYTDLRDEVAQLYKVPFGELITWNGLMPLAIEQNFIIHIYDNGIYVYVDDLPYQAFTKDHPTKERAVAVAILKALKAKAEQALTDKG